MKEIKIDTQDNKDVFREIAAADAAIGSGTVSRSSAAVMKKPKKKRMYRFVKRTFDIVSSGLALLVFSWLILLILLIKSLEDAGHPAYELAITEAADVDSPKA